MAKRARRTPTASCRFGINGTAISSRFEGMCVKTMVLIRPMRPASLAAAKAEKPARILAPKKMAPSAPGGAPNRTWNQ